MAIAAFGTVAVLNLVDSVKVPALRRRAPKRVEGVPHLVRPRVARASLARSALAPVLWPGVAQKKAQRGETGADDDQIGFDDACNSTCVSKGAYSCTRGHDRDSQPQCSLSKAVRRVRTRQARDQDDKPRNGRHQRDEAGAEPRQQGNLLLPRHLEADDGRHGKPHEEHVRHAAHDGLQHVERRPRDALAREAQVDGGRDGLAGKHDGEPDDGKGRESHAGREPHDAPVPDGRGDAVEEETEDKLREHRTTSSE